jgi:hypothetical protein
MDVHLAEALRASLFMLEPDWRIVLSPASHGAGQLKQNVADGVHESDAFVLLAGPNGVSRWQETELNVAFDRRYRESRFPLVTVLVGKAEVPNFLIPYDLKWFKLPVVTDRTMLRVLLDEIQRSAG